MAYLIRNFLLGKADQDWWRDPRAVRHVSDGRGGYSETTQNPMGWSARIRTNSADGRLQWLLLGREWPQEGP